MNLIEVNNVTKCYGHLRALDQVSLTIQRGEIHGLMGPNGAGKSTLIRMLAGITQPDTGTIHFHWNPSFLTHHPLGGGREGAPHPQLVGYLPEERGLYKKMRVGDQALFLAQLKGLSKTEAETHLREWFDRFGIYDWWNKPVESLSKGMAQKLQFITTVLHRPQLVILDEPFSGFDPVNAKAVKDEILRLRDQGTTFILSTHDMESVEQLCDSITLINHGQVVLQGRTADIQQQYSTGEVRTIPVVPSMNEIFIQVVSQ